MQVPLTVSFKGVPVSEGVRTACWNEAEKLDRYFDRITSCHVTVSLPQHQRKGNHYDIHVRLAVPGGEIVVSHAPTEHKGDEKPQLAVREAFDEVRRQLQDYARRQRGDTKHHVVPERPPERGASCAATGEGFHGLPEGERLYRHRTETGGARPPGDGADWKDEPE
jgi:ribosome-associated translation inhibitor RaiA